MWNGYLRLGGNEIVNTPRVVALASSLGLPLGIECDECPGLADMAGAVYGDAEEFGDVTTAPWYDANDPASEDFIGFVGLKIRDTLDSTREAPVFQRLGDGGVLGRERHRTREVRVTGLLIGRDRLSIDYGMNWLSSALGRNSCGQHGMTCGLADLEWLADCPAAQGAETDPDYAAAVAPLRRFVHDVGTTSGPLLLEERETDCFQIYEIEFTITAQEPRVFGAPKAFELTPALITGKSDVVRNLIKNPSAENILQIGFPDIAAENYIDNPSFETTTSGWGALRTPVRGSYPPGRAEVLLRSRSRPMATSGEWYAEIDPLDFLATESGTARYLVRSVIMPMNETERSAWENRSFRAGCSLYGGLYRACGVILTAYGQDGSTELATTETRFTAGRGGMVDLITDGSLTKVQGIGMLLFQAYYDVPFFAGTNVRARELWFDSAWITEG